MKKLIHVDTQAVSYNRRHKTNKPALIVVEETEDGQLEERQERVSSIIIRDDQGEEVARVVYTATAVKKDVAYSRNGIIHEVNAWIETSLNIETATEAQLPDPGPGLPSKRRG